MVRGWLEEVPECALRQRPELAVDLDVIAGVPKLALESGDIDRVVARAACADPVTRVVHDRRRDHRLVRLRIVERIPRATATARGLRCRGGRAPAEVLRSVRCGVWNSIAVAEGDERT